MNKQELIDKLKRHLTLMPGSKGSEYDKGYEWATKQHLALIAELDEPVRPPEPKQLGLKKTVVPQFVADWYEEHKDDFEDGIYELCVQFYQDEVEPSTNLYRWFYRDDGKPIETLVKMRLYGYEVEKEKLYTVEIPNPNGDGYRRVYLGKNEDNKIKLHVWDCFPSIEFSNDWKQLDIAQLTETEIKEDFAWAWKFAEEVEE